MSCIGFQRQRLRLTRHHEEVARNSEADDDRNYHDGDSCQRAGNSCAFHQPTGGFRNDEPTSYPNQQRLDGTQQAFKLSVPVVMISVGWLGGLADGNHAVSAVIKSLADRTPLATTLTAPFHTPTESSIAAKFTVTMTDRAAARCWRSCNYLYPASLILTAQKCSIATPMTTPFAANGFRFKTTAGNYLPPTG